MIKKLAIAILDKYLVDSGAAFLEFFQKHVTHFNIYLQPGYPESISLILNVSQFLKKLFYKIINNN